MTTAPRRPSAGASNTSASGPWRFAAMLTLDVALPLMLFYGLRAAGADTWTALIAGAIIPVVRVAVTAILARRVERVALFSLTLLTIGTGIGLVTGDARLLVVRESYLTVVVGVWIGATTLMRRPLVFTATIGFMSADDAQTWRRAWCTNPRFRRLMRAMTAGFAGAFLLDAAARITMAYTLALDLVPVLSTALLVVLLTAVVQAGKAYGRRHLATGLITVPPLEAGPRSATPPGSPARTSP